MFSRESLELCTEAKAKAERERERARRNVRSSANGARTRHASERANEQATVS